MSLSDTVIRRLPLYLHFLRQQPEDTLNISATGIAAGLGLGDVQVRKDLALISGAGKPKIGYDRLELIDAIEDALGNRNKKPAVIAGAGKLGTAFLEFDGFDDFGINIAAAFDSDARKTGYSGSGKYIYPMADFEDFCRTENIVIGIVTVPASAAQDVCDKMVASGIRAIWNFAPVRPTVPDGVLLQNENLASSLALLSSRLA